MTDTSPPTADVTVGAHVHFGMTGTAPLRLADLFFTDEGLYIAEYGHVTPFFGLLGGTHRRSAAEFATTLTEEGLPAAFAESDVIRHVPSEEIERVVLYDGGLLAREKVAVYTAGSPPYAYRVHAPIDLDALADALRAFEPLAAPVETRSGVGFDPLESLSRFRSGQ